MKFGKYLEARQLELPEYNGYFIDYKALKKLIKKLSLKTYTDSTLDTNTIFDNSDANGDTESNTNLPFYKNLQCNKAMFFFKLERELEKVNEYYMERENNFKIMIEVLQKKFEEYKQRGRLTSKTSSSFKYLFESLKRFQRDLNHLTQFVELNRTGFSKVLKKWDKRSHSHTKDFYLMTVVSVQPIFTRNTEVSQFNDVLINLLMELDDIRQEMPTEFPAHNVGVGNENKFSTLQNYSSDNLLNIELEIDIWFKEVNSICQLKDLEPKLKILKNFPTKVIDFIKRSNSTNEHSTDTLIKSSLTKLFYLLISSDKVDDECLETLFISAEGLSKYLDFLFLDDEAYVFTKRNIFHEAASCPYFDRSFILTQSIKHYSLENEQFIAYLKNKDFNGRTPLHYASELGKFTFVKLLVGIQPLDVINFVDKSSNTALNLSIINNYPSIVTLLLSSYPHFKSYKETDIGFFGSQLPINVACMNNNYEIAKIILDTVMKDYDLNSVFGIQGRRPLHLAAENGADVHLLKLLCSNGCDVNLFDSVNTWTPLIYAVNNGHTETVKSLIVDCDADVDLCDENKLCPIFYACWQGHIDVLNVLIAQKKLVCTGSTETQLLPIEALTGKEIPLTKVFKSITPLASESVDIDTIPDFTLPPPILPLRKYGHNFLEKKLFLKLHFKPGFQCIKLNEEQNGLVSTSNLGRITLTSNIVDSISRNISLPVESVTGNYNELGLSAVTFHNGNTINNENGVDSTDEIIFQINDLNVCHIDLEIYPVSGTRMIAKTILTSDILKNNINQSSNQGSVVLPLMDSRLKLIGQIVFDFQIIFPFTKMPLEITQFETYWKSTGDDEVTSSSLVGDYLTLLVTLLNDGSVIVAPKITIANGNTEMLLLDLSSQQVESIIGKSLSDVSEFFDDMTKLRPFLENNYVSFDSLLSVLPSNIKIDIKVSFPTDNEVKNVPVKLTSPFVNVDKFVDDVLSSTLTFVQKSGAKSSKKVVFSSSNYMICSILNWKQPVFPVVFNMNGIVYSKQSENFELDSQNHLSHIALQHSVDVTDFNYRSVSHVVNFARANNLLGVMIPSDLLIVCPKLIDEIKSSGLLLITSGLHEDNSNVDSVILNNAKINGIKNNGYLQFKNEDTGFMI